MTSNNLYQACCHLYDFRIPIPKDSVDFKISLKSCLQVVEVAEFAEILTSSRRALVSSLQGREDSADQSLEILNPYLENLLRFSKSIDLSTSAAGEDIFKFDIDPIYEWRGHLTGESLFFGTNSLIYELIMVLHTKAILYHQKARNLIALDVISQLAEAGKHLLTAASIMNGICRYLTTEILPAKLNNKVQNPPEVYHSVCLSLYHYFRGSAEAMSTVKALTTPSTPLQLKSRLALGVMNSAVSALSYISTVFTASNSNYLFLVHLAAVRELFAAIAFFHLAESYMDKKEVGIAMAYCTAAKPHLNVQQRAVFCLTEQGMPSCSHLPAATSYLILCLDSVYSTAERENRFVYFLQVPTTQQLPALPPELSVMNPAPYTEPPVAKPPLKFVCIRQKSVFSSFMSSLYSATGSSSSSNASSTVNAPVEIVAVSEPSTSQVVDDEALAKELQRQFDSETASASSASGAGVTYSSSGGGMV